MSTVTDNGQVVQETQAVGDEAPATVDTAQAETPAEEQAKPIAGRFRRWLKTKRETTGPTLTARLRAAFGRLAPFGERLVAFRELNEELAEALIALCMLAFALIAGVGVACFIVLVLLWPALVVPGPTWVGVIAVLVWLLLLPQGGLKLTRQAGQTLKRVLRAVSETA